MSGRVRGTGRASIVAAAVVAGAVAGGLVGRTLRRARGRGTGGPEPLSLRPPDDLGPVASFDGTQLAVRAAGRTSDPMLLFAHGFSLDLTAWHYQWTALSERYRCVLFDFRSHGRSDRAAGGDVTPAAFGLDLAAVIDAVAPDRPVVIVGHGIGSTAGLAMAESRPDLFDRRVAGAVFAGSAMNELGRGAMGSVSEALRPRLGSVREVARRANRLRRYVLGRRPDVGHLVARMTQFGPDASPEVVDHVVGLAAGARTEVWTDALAGLLDSDLRHAARHVGVPAMVVAGEHDRMTPPSSAVALADELPRGTLQVLERAGHVPMMEVPEEFNRRVDAFATGALLEAERRRA